MSARLVRAARAPRSARALAVSLMALAALAASPRPARPSCGADNCPLDQHAAHGMGRRFSFDLSYQLIRQDRVLVGSRSAAVGALASPEDEVRTITRMTTALGYARLTERWQLSAALPFVERTHRHIRNEEGRPPAPLEWNYSGPGDLTLLSHWAATRDPAAPLTVTLQLGARLPVGRRHVATVDGEEPEPPARPGTGSLDGLAGIHLMHRVGLPAAGGLRPGSFFAGALLRVNGRGTDDYRVGNEVQASCGGSWPLAHELGVLGQLNARFRGKDDPGRTDALRDNTGGASLYAQPGAAGRDSCRDRGLRLRADPDLPAREPHPARLALAPVRGPCLATRAVRRRTTPASSGTAAR
ncbi:MAG: hypothetical protein HZC42_11050 [Candidatus Eisenbacteria bacterium]|nr:hypothetical protein [Candidatus Eisenbacteria bacterium]